MSRTLESMIWDTANARWQPKSTLLTSQYDSKNTRQSREAHRTTAAIIPTSRCTLVARVQIRLQQRSHIRHNGNKRLYTALKSLEDPPTRHPSTAPSTFRNRNPFSH